VGKVDGFSPHAAVATQAHEWKKLKRICRYIARPAVAEPPLSLTKSGNMRYESGRIQRLSHAHRLSYFYQKGA